MSSPLEPFQRAQLTRSIHKLSKVLGTTPQLVDYLPTGPDADNQKRPAPLLLRHHSVSYCIPSTPTRANTLRSVHNTRAARRRTIAKLSRTFGEAVPLELVLTVEHSLGDEESEEWNCSSESLSPLLVTRSHSVEAL